MTSSSPEKPAASSSSNITYSFADLTDPKKLKDAVAGDYRFTHLMRTLRYHSLGTYVQKGGNPNREIIRVYNGSYPDEVAFENRKCSDVSIPFGLSHHTIGTCHPLVFLLHNDVFASRDNVEENPEGYDREDRIIACARALFQHPDGGKSGVCYLPNHLGFTPVDYAAFSKRTDLALEVIEDFLNHQYLQFEKTGELDVYTPDIEALSLLQVPARLPQFFANCRRVRNRLCKGLDGNMQDLRKVMQHYSTPNTTSDRRYYDFCARYLDAWESLGDVIDRVAQYGVNVVTPEEFDRARNDYNSSASIGFIRIRKDKRNADITPYTPLADDAPRTPRGERMQEFTRFMNRMRESRYTPL